MWEDDEKTSEWEDSAWNFKSGWFRRKNDQAAEMRRLYEERQERVRNSPPDEDEWNK